jgi:hypothetical protein
MFLSTFGRRRWSSCSTKTTKTTAFMMVLLFLWTIIDDEVSALTTTTTTTTRKTVTIRHNIFQAGRQFPQVERNDVLRPYSSTALFAAGSEDDNDNDNDNDDTSSPPTVSTLERLKISGVSVSPNGFHVILQRNPASEEAGRYIPIKVTNDIQDAFAATTPESLTLCQLLSGVDMAGVILPPELLSKIVVYHIEEKIQQQQQQQKQTKDQEGQQLQLSPQEQKIVEKIQESLPDNQESYKDSHVWFQSRMSIPQITLDQLTLIPDGRNTWKCRLDCAVPDLKDRLVLEVEKEILSSLLYQYDAETSLMFTCIALALRYKAPIVLEVPSQHHDSTTTASFATTLQRLEQEFPKRTTVDRLQQQSTRVARNIERGFEIHKLQGALRVAMKLGDQRAVEKIRAKLDEYDSMDSLPTTTTATTTTTTTVGGTNNNSIDEDDDDDRLDDLDKNILQ